MDLCWHRIGQKVFWDEIVSFRGGPDYFEWDQSYAEN